MNQIMDRPNAYPFGTEFNYAVWTANTIVTLTNVPWNNDYRDIVRFSDKTALNAYIDGNESANTKIENLSYAPATKPIRLDIPFNSAYKFNYVRASNPLMPVAGDTQKDFYYFIVDVRYIAPNTTEIVVQLDVWQTFGYDITFGNSYIERGHIGIANTRSFQSFGRDYLSIPEGLDVGGEYRVVNRVFRSIMGPYDHDILVCSTVSLDPDTWGSVAEPKLRAASGGVFAGLPSGAKYWVLGSDGSLLSFMNAMSEKPWISQGIISMTTIPKLTKYISGFTYEPSGEATTAPSTPIKGKTTSMLTNWRNSPAVVSNIPERYRHLKKLWTYPYMVVELSTNTGSPLVLKPECWPVPNAPVVERLNLTPPTQRLAFLPQSYNANEYTPIVPAPIDGDGWDGGEYLDMSTVISNFPTLALVNNMSANYLASNAASIAYQNSAADWSQQRALGSNQVAYDQATAGMNLNAQLTNMGIGTDAAQTALSNSTAMQQGLLAAAGSMAGGAGGGKAGIAQGMIGASAGNISTIIQQNANTQALAIRNAQASGATDAQTGNGMYVRDTNANLAEWAARGDYQQTIAGINAKIQDSKLTQPSTSGQVGGDAMNYVNGEMGIEMKVKLLDNAAMRVVGEYWLRYGYAVRQFAKIPADFMVMTKFTYWKLSETYITSGTMPETMKQTIRGIFEKGVTVWKNPADIGVIDIADNQALPGITL